MTSTATATRHSITGGLLEGHRVSVLASHDAGVPLLYPWANRLGAAGYRFGGRAATLKGSTPRDEHGLPIHGLMVDPDGNVYTTGGPGLLVLNTGRSLVHEIELPGAVSFAFAGSRLLVTTDDAIWAVDLADARR